LLISRAVKRAVFEFYTYRLSYTSLASKIVSSRTEDHGIYHGELSVKIFFPFIFFPANHFPSAGSSVSQRLAASGSRSYVSRAFREIIADILLCSRPTYISWKWLFATLPFTGSITTRCENQSLAWRELRFLHLSLTSLDCCRRCWSSRVKRRTITTSFLEAVNAEYRFCFYINSKNSRLDLLTSLRCEIPVFSGYHLERTSFILVSCRISMIIHCDVPGKLRKISD